ncbi:MAG: 30S ribosomal protein S5 [Planctomycetes bacterium]|jgi:small subunit ribosomal protein S5|nr:30S ribosomal protein S5 [Planctomycetota bacterium]HKB15353.1 30S ribosomal protein S5 [Planctomycetota bacterium]
MRSHEPDYLSPSEVAELNLEDAVVRINRSAAVVKGGRRFSFSALVAVGNRELGVVGLGYGKAREVPSAVEKAVKDAKKRLVKIPRVGTTLPHLTEGRWEASRVRLVPAAPGTGIKAGMTVRRVVELAGVRDVLTKAYGSRNPVNLARAALRALLDLRTKEEVAETRGVAL